MKATIWHNPKCGTSRKTLEILQAEPGVEVEIIEYLKTPPSREKLAELYERAGMTPQQGLRRKEKLVQDLDLDHVSDTAVLKAMIADPIIIERPLVETEKGVRLCRPQEKVREIL
ncbi:arsenate reductase (glutaredoxin) [Sphingomonas cavernae]|uniref:Arsenate reductase n=1 Tax=Sphingomonas cavernae TaxID=2320861 RepID=A0A418W6P2_9SPHN|nr:arsenate reductase (glutaredoxin) [Sphingomonas cavernae]RJF85628.1 arsenate reductase (glutaredoxin) [Sphingomonas cavernae]